MNMDEKFDEKILALIMEGVPGKFKKQHITREMRLQKDLGLDSLALAALVFRLEDVFGVDLSGLDLGSNMGQMRTVSDAIDMSRNLVRQARAGANP